jgi:hypothetical protein
MSRRLLVLNGLLGVAACLLAVALVRELAAAQPLPPPSIAGGTPPPAVPEPSAAETSSSDLVSAGGDGVIAAKNLFSPSRAEAPAGPAVAVGLKPLLHGVVIDGSSSRAFLEDPAAKRTFGYGVGDTVGGGQVQSITRDRVVIALPDGLVEVLLHDPSRPRPAATPPGAGTVPVAAGAGLPGVPARPAAITVPSVAVPGTGAPPGLNPLPPIPAR